MSAIENNIYLTCLDCNKPLSNPSAKSPRCKKCGANNRWGNIGNSITALVVLLAEEKLSVSEISAHVGRSRERVYQILDASGHYMRKPQKNKNKQ